jgi:hypothetical protein
MSKNNVTVIVIGVMSFSFAYFSFAFAEWQINAKYWSSIDRTAALVFGICLFGIGLCWLGWFVENSKK